MNVLFIGGTGNISSACIRPALEKGFDVFLYNRGNSRMKLPREVVQLQGDIRDREQTRAALSDYHFDVVVDWVAFTREHVEQDIALFSGNVKQYIFISTASAYQKPPVHPVITESTPLDNPFWEYSRNKIAAEERLMQEYRENNFPMTIVRPSHTYGDSMIPSIFDRGPITLDRIKKEKEIIVPGDGTSWWVVTHNSDFAKAIVGLLGQPAACGQAFQITSDEALTWDQINTIIAGHMGREARIVHIPADFICSRYPEFQGPLKGDKIYSVRFDNSKIKRLVPEFICSTPFSVGVERSVRWFLDNPDSWSVNEEVDQKLDDIIEAYRNYWS